MTHDASGAHLFSGTADPSAMERRAAVEHVEAKALEWARRVLPHPAEHTYWNHLIATGELHGAVQTRLQQALRALERETFGRL